MAMSRMGNNLGSTTVPWSITNSPIAAPIYRADSMRSPGPIWGTTAARWARIPQAVASCRLLVYSGTTVKSTACHCSPRLPPVSEKMQGVQPDQPEQPEVAPTPPAPPSRTTKTSGYTSSKPHRDITDDVSGNKSTRANKVVEGDAVFFF